MKNLSMSVKVFIGFGAGIIFVLGLVFQENILFIQPIGDLFSKLIWTIVIPMAFLSIISGVAGIGRLCRTGMKVLSFYIVINLYRRAGYS